MRTVAIICIECSIRVYYDDCSIRVSRSFTNSSQSMAVVLSRAGAYGTLHGTGPLFSYWGTVMLSSNV